MTFLAVVLLVVVAAFLVELLFRTVGHVATEPLWWHDLMTQRKELQMRRMARRGRMDVCVIGASMMHYGVDPAAIAQRLGVRCYNASIYRGIPKVTEAWLNDVVMPILRPRLLVVGLSAVESNDNTPLVHRYDEYRAARVFSRSPLRRLQIALARRSYAVRFAPHAKMPRRYLGYVLTALRTPSAWRWDVPLAVPAKWGELGEATDMLDRSFRVTPRMGEIARQQVGAGYKNMGEQAAAWSRLPALCRRYGTTLVFTVMPAPRSMFDTIFEGGYERYLREQAALVAMAESHGVPVIDVVEGIDDEAHFADQLHCNRLGRDLFTARLAEALVPYWSAVSNDAGGHADGDRVRRDLAADDGVGADDGAGSDRGP